MNDSTYFFNGTVCNFNFRAISQPGQVNKEDWNWGGALEGAAHGAEIGEDVDPWGAAEGAVIENVFGGMYGRNIKETAPVARNME